jgi:hypothetical protein
MDAEMTAGLPATIGTVASVILSIKTLRRERDLQRDPRGVARSTDNPVADYAEELSGRAHRLTLAPSNIGCSYPGPVPRR